MAERAKAETFEELRGIQYPDAREKDEPYYRFLYLLAQTYQPKVIVELGTYIGTSARCLSLGAPEAQVITYDVNPAAAEHLAGEERIEARTENACYAMYKGEPIDLLYIDADHSFNTTMGEWERWLPHVRPGGLIVVDDTDLDDEMRRFMDHVRNYYHFDVLDLPGLHHTGMACTYRP